MTYIDTKDPVAVALTEAVKKGDTESLRRLLAENPDLSQARFGSERESRSSLHIATDWPGNFPNVAETIRVLAEAGADVNARFEGATNHKETPLHWAASSDDVAALDTLLDAGADIEAGGAVLGGGPAMADAAGFLCLKAAARLLERGAKTTIGQSAALGLMDRLEKFYDGDQLPTSTETDLAFWMACHGGQLQAAEYLLTKGANMNCIPPWEQMTPLDAAVRSKATDIVGWLIQKGAVHADHHLR